MARKPRITSMPLEDQLKILSEEIVQVKENLEELEAKKTELSKQIEEKKMKEAYDLLKQNGISVEELAEMLKTKSVNENVKATKGSKQEELVEAKAVS